jgi:hypothetical protein
MAVSASQVGDNFILVHAKDITLIYLKDCEYLCATMEVALSVYFGLYPENLNANLPYLKGRYELVKGPHFGEILKRV